MSAARVTSPWAASRNSRLFCTSQMFRSMSSALHPRECAINGNWGNWQPSSAKKPSTRGFWSHAPNNAPDIAAKTPADYEYNVEITRKVSEMAHWAGVSVEGELGCLGSLETMKGDKEDGHGAEGTMTREQLLTDPEQAADFVKKTQLDALAIDAIHMGAFLDTAPADQLRHAQARGEEGQFVQQALLDEQYKKYDITVSDEEADLYESVKNGPSGYPLKDSSIEEVAQAFNRTERNRTQFADRNAATPGCFPSGTDADCRGANSQVRMMSWPCGRMS